jgi:hyaluronoglucosaminidase
VVATVTRRFGATVVVLALTLVTAPGVSSAAATRSVAGATAANRADTEHLGGVSRVGVVKDGVTVGGASPRVPAVWPTPQRETVGRGGSALPGTVREVVGSGADPAAVAALNSVLRGDGVRHIGAGAAGFTVVVGSSGADPLVAAALSRLGVPGPAGLAAEGYVLAGGRGSLVLAGVDGAGTFHAVQTLRQLVAHRWVPDVTIRDWPAFGLRGVIEGFYGAPWSTADRVSSFDFDGATKMNTYVYSPKDDPYLRAQWRQPYPADQLAVIKNLVDRATADHVTFTYALSPGLSICYSSTADIAALEAKLQTMWDIGVRAFAIPFDDIDPSKWNCTADQAAFGDPGGAGAGKAQVNVLNAVATQFIATHQGAAPLEFVPTEYYDTKASPYKQVIAAGLKPAVTVEWTGEGVIAPVVTDAQAAVARQVFGHPILLWDNYPVNDYVTDRLLMGPYAGRDAGLPSELAGITANPMIQEEPSKVALFTVADYLWNPSAYDADPRGAWLAGISAIGGLAAGALRVLAENSYSSLLNSAESPALTPPIAAFWDSSAASGPLLGYFDSMAAAPARIRAGLPGLAAEVGPWLDKLGLYGRAGRQAVELVLALQDGDGARAAAARSSLDGLRVRLGAITQTVAAGVMDPFLDRVVSTGSGLATLRTSGGSLAFPGKALKLTATVTNTSAGPLGGIRVGLPVPAGWRVTPGVQGVAELAPGASGSVAWTVTPPPSAAPGTVTLDAYADFSSGGARRAVVAGWSAAVPYPSLAATFGNAGVTDDANISPAGLNGGLDGDGSTLSAQELATHGLTPGASFTAGGISFGWPAAAAGAAGNTLADGQAIALNGAGTTLGLVTTGSYAPVTGTGQVVYTDGSTQAFTLTDPDWQATTGGVVAVATTYHNLAGTGQVHRPANLYLNTVPLTAGKTVAAVILPTVSDHTTGGTRSLHIFAIAVN